MNLIKERVETYGTTSLLPAEAIHILTGIPVEKLNSFIEKYGIPEIVKFISELSITHTQKKKLQVLFDTVKKISTAPYKEKEMLNSSTLAGEYFIKELQYLREEHFMIAFLDTQNRIIDTVTIFKGTLTEAPVYTREIIKMVIEKNSNAIICAHNHPGGTLKASPSDIQSTIETRDALKSIKVKLVDHIIVADNKYLSMAEEGLIVNN